MPGQTVNIAGFREKASERPEPYDGKLSCTVLRGARGLVTVLRGGNAPRLPGARCKSVGLHVNKEKAGRVRTGLEHKTCIRCESVMNNNRLATTDIK